MRSRDSLFSSSPAELAAQIKVSDFSFSRTVRFSGNKSKKHISVTFSSEDNPRNIIAGSLSLDRLTADLVRSVFYLL